MDIQLESTNSHTIQSYSETSITINQICYQQSLFVTNNQIETAWAVPSITDLSKEKIEPLLIHQPDIILIGHASLNQRLSLDMIAYLSTKRIGVECMSIGAACRTFNVLSSEERAVVLVFIPNA